MVDESSDDGQVFTDARDTALTPTRDTVLSPLTIPTTRVEKVDSSPSHGEVPGTPAYEKRLRDAVPDEIEIIPEGQRSRASSRAMASPSSTSPSRSPIPMTRVEKVDVTSPSYGEVPGTLAWEKRKADAVPDSIDKATPENRSTSPNQSSSLPIIPKTVLTRVDSEPAHSAAPGTDTYHFRQHDVMPDIIEKERNLSSKHQSASIENMHSKQSSTDPPTSKE